MPKCAVFLAILALGTPLPAPADEPTQPVSDDSDDTLRLFLSKSPIVIVGEVAGAAEKEIACGGELPSVANYGFEVKVQQVLQGAEKRDRLRVEIARFDDHWPAAPKVGDKHVFFLKPLYADRERNDRTNPLISVDKWFGMQPASPSLIAGLLRVAPRVKPPEDSPAAPAQGLQLRFKGRSPEHLSAAFEVRNLTDKPIAYLGYTAESFDPNLPSGTVAPLYSIELQQDGKWVDHQVGFCKFGQGPVEFPPRDTVSFDAHLPEGSWDAFRIGVRLKRVENGEPKSEIVWSRKLFRSALQP